MGTRHTSEAVVRGVHDGINLEIRDIALPVQNPESYSNLESSADGHNRPQRYAIQEGRLVRILG